MLIESVILAILIGKLFGGKLSILQKVQIRGLHFVLLGYLIEFVAAYLMDHGSPGTSAWVFAHTLELQIATYVLLGVFFALNFHFLGIKFLAAGSFLNFLVITANQGLMPVSAELALRTGHFDAVQLLNSGAVFGHKALDRTVDALIALADIIEIPEPYLFPKTISAGDILIGFGAFFLIFFNMFYSKNSNRPV